MFGHRTWTGKFYKFIFCAVFAFVKRVVSLHPLIPDLFPEGILTPKKEKKRESERYNISNLNITHETKQQQKILWSTNIGSVYEALSKHEGKDGTLAEIKSFIKLFFRFERLLGKKYKGSINSFNRNRERFLVHKHSQKKPQREKLSSQSPLSALIFGTFVSEKKE